MLSLHSYQQELRTCRPLALRVSCHTKLTALLLRPPGELQMLRGFMRLRACWTAPPPHQALRVAAKLMRATVTCCVSQLRRTIDNNATCDPWRTGAPGS